MKLNELSTEVIRPGDEKWLMQDEMMVMARAALDRHTCVFAASFHGFSHDFHDDNESYCRFYRFHRQEWICCELQARIRSMTRYRAPGWSSYGLAILGEDGDVWYLGEQSFKDRINAPGAHVLTRIKCFGDALIVTGFGGQVYRQDAEGWHHDDLGLLGSDPPVPRPRPDDRGSRYSCSDLIVIEGDDVTYSCGSIHIARPALYWRRGSEEWKWLGLDPTNLDFDFIKLRGLYAERSSEVWITTDRGYLLKGNGSEGFRVGTHLSRDRDGTPTNFYNIARYGDDLFVGGTTVCRLRADSKLEPQAGPAHADFTDPMHLSTFVEGTVEVVDGVLWAIGKGVLARYDVNTWEKFTMPTIYKCFLEK